MSAKRSSANWGRSRKKKYMTTQYTDSHRVLLLISCCFQDCARLDWAVLKVMKYDPLTFSIDFQLIVIFVSQWNQPSIDFYEKSLGAKALSEWVGMRLEEDGIERLKKFAL